MPDTKPTKTTAASHPALRAPRRTKVQIAQDDLDAANARVKRLYDRLMANEAEHSSIAAQLDEAQADQKYAALNPKLPSATTQPTVE